jgi:hypothetical protein
LPDKFEEGTPDRGAEDPPYPIGESLVAGAIYKPTGDESSHPTEADPSDSGHDNCAFQAVNVQQSLKGAPKSVAGLRGFGCRFNASGGAHRSPDIENVTIRS